MVGLYDHGLDFEHHLRAAPNACKFIVRDKNVSISKRLAYLAAMVPPAACFAGGHRKIYKQDLRKLDIKFRKLVRTILGPPGHGVMSLMSGMQAYWMSNCIHCHPS